MALPFFSGAYVPEKKGYEPGTKHSAADRAGAYGSRQRAPTEPPGLHPGLDDIRSYADLCVVRLLPRSHARGSSANEAV